MATPVQRTRPTDPQKSPRLLRENVYDQIKQQILTGALRPGRFLGEEQVARRLAVSRTPIREALARLQRDGLVEIVPHRGAFVRWPSARDVEEVFDIRIGLEVLALRKAFPRLTEGMLRPLLERVDRQAATLATLTHRDVEDLNVDIHMTVLEAAGNQRIIELIRQLREQVYVGSTLYQSTDGTVNPSRVGRIMAEHRELLIALLDRDLDRAVRMLEEHLASAREMVMTALREGVRGT